MSPDRGIAVVALLYGMSVFSVLSLSLLRNAELEKTFRTGDDPDLHVVLYAGGANSQTMIGRLNLPTASRNPEGPDASTEVRIPGAPHLNMASELPPGWSYAVRLSPEARVCCDGGDNACASVTWDESIVAGSVAPPLGRPIKQGAASRELQFALSALAVPPEVSLDPRATASSAFLVRATRLLAGATSSSRESEPITCTLTSGDATVATGTLRIQPNPDNNKTVTRISSGTPEPKDGGTDGRR